MMDKDAGTKEIEKPFRCSVCTLGFTNEDHLQVHKRRHEMSLNLSKENAGGSSTNETFIDETPTPTRFIRNCEEVGLFQDLQSVNPFDEQFVKASSSTPTENGFDFTFTFKNSHPTSISLIDTSTDTLNTPQVLGFQPVTPVIHLVKSASVTAKLPTGNVEDKVNKDNIAILCESPKDLGNSSRNNTRPGISRKPKGNLKLNLSPATDSDVKCSSSGSSVPSATTPTTTIMTKTKKSSKKSQVTSNKKVCILERNRAAASRSRQRRKQYISALELKCTTLQSKLSQTQSELAKSKAENMFLKGQLELHSNCNVTLKNSPLSVSISSFSPVVTNKIILSPTTIQQQHQNFKPSILRQNSQKQIPSNVVLVSTQEDTETFSHMNCIPGPNLTAITSKPKRGRPKKGFEKRVSGLSLISTSSSEPPKKVQILPISAYKKVVLNLRSEQQ